MDEFLRKPYSAEQVRRCIAGVLARRNGKPAVSEPASLPVTTGSGLNLKAFRFYGLGAPDQADQAAQHYLEALDQELTVMAQALETNHGDQLARSAHRVHALGGLIGARAISDAAQELEVLPRHAPPAERQRLCRVLTTAIAAVKEQIKSLAQHSK